MLPRRRGSGRRVPQPAAGPRRHCRQRRRRPPRGARRRARRRAGVEAGDRERLRVAPAARIHPADAFRRGRTPARHGSASRRAAPRRTCPNRAARTAGPSGQARTRAQTARAHPQHHRRRVSVHPRRFPVSGRQRCAGPLHRGHRRGKPEALHRRGGTHPRPARGHRAAHARPARAASRPPRPRSPPSPRPPRPHRGRTAWSWTRRSLPLARLRARQRQ